MLKRKIADLIEQHLKSGSGRILLIDGARQVGKTYIIRHVGKKLFPNFIEINMLEDSVGARLFENAKTVDDFYLRVSAIKGELMFAAGTQANPLDVVSLSRHLLFFDARDNRQVRQARELMARYQGKVKPILTAGSYLNLMKSWHIPVYYDQQGLLTRRLGIAQVPALVSQEGKRLRIDEMEVPR